MATTHYTDNRYELRKKRNAILGEEFYKDEKDSDLGNVPTATNKEKLTKTAKGLTSDLLLGVIGGGLAGALLGKYSFLVGLGVAGYGHYSDNKLLGTVGLGMMASGTAYALLGGKEQDPNATTMEKVTERLNGFKNELKRKVWIDKWGSKDGLNGLSGNAAENKSSANTQKENQKSNASAGSANNADFTKPVEPINPNQFSKLTKDEEAKLDEQMQNATILAFNQFYALRHNLGGVNDASANSATNASAINDLENEIKKATDASTSSATKTATKQTNSELNKENSKPADKDFDEDDKEDWESYASGAKTKQNYSGTKHSYKSKSKTDELEDLEISERLF
ncbi:MAG: hypothetical protein A3F72_01690 [Bacteroidetes bacterium RIFCSPLOWO2_12_FULL_35_15]|nr:MAG: hypothetical protein A3F72_01690 [Bacteroidetes bacterium RIFCSPLOWO2_12_FULL_35_15]